MNTIKTAFLLGALTGILLLAGGAIAGQEGVTIALVFAAILNIGAYWFSDRIVLAMTKARPVDPKEAPELWNIVRRVAEKADMPMPRVYVIEQAQPNAFATGRSPKHAVVGVTTGIMRLLDARELEGVIAHEIGHVANRDTLVSAVAATIAGAITWVAYMALFMGGRRNPLLGLLVFMLAPIAATLIRLAISRGRELGADESGARVTQDPMALASALSKMEQTRHQVPMQVSPSAAHLFFVNPLSGQNLAGLFSTHPPTRERVARLRRMAGLAD